MRLPFHTFRVVVAAGVSLWMAVVACLMGCTVPILASSASASAASIVTSIHATSVYAKSLHENSARQSEPDLMAGIENCPHHHSGGNVPAKPSDPKPGRGGGMSCCPVEVTVASKPDTVTLHIAPASDFVLAPEFSSATNRFFHSVEFVPPVWHSGRDTLLETHLLRI